VIVDTSALAAILKGEPDAADFAAALDAAQDSRLSAANFLELAIVVDSRKQPIGARRMDDLIRDADIAITPVTEAQARIAREAYRDYGKGSGHPAQLNSATASPMRWPAISVSPFSTRAPISRIPTSSRRCADGPAAWSSRSTEKQASAKAGKTAEPQGGASRAADEAEPSE
jgi:ribonuclease VapC